MAASPGRLWIFNHHAATPDQSTGTRHFDLARELVGAGWKVTIFAAGFGHFSGREEQLRGWQLVRSEQRDGVEFVWLRTVPYRGNGIGRVLNMISYFVMALSVQTRFGRPTHVIGSTVHPLAAAAGLVVARWHRARFFFEIRDLWPQTLIDLGRITDDGLPARALRRLERYLVENAVAVLTVLPGTREYLEWRGIKPRRVAVIPNGVRIHAENAVPAQETSAASALRAAHVEGCFVLVYAGAHGIANGLDSVLTAAGRLRHRGHADIRIVLIGDGPEKERLESRANVEGLENVTFLPPLPKRTIPSLLAAADACLLHIGRSPVHRFGVSFNKLYDYMASGRPIVFACDVPDDPVRLAAAGISVRDDDADALADAIVAMRDTPAEERSSMGARARRYVEQHHATDSLARKLEAELTA